MIRSGRLDFSRSKLIQPVGDRFVSSSPPSSPGAVASAAGALLGREDLVAPWWASLLLFSAWACLSAYPQIQHVDDHHGERYVRRSWAAPIMTGLSAICAIPFGAAVVAGYRAAAGQ